MLDSLTEHIAVLDSQGIIIAVNRAWREFGKKNGAQYLSQHSVGLNYLAVCANATKYEFNESADAVETGIRDVLMGTRSDFDIEYPCHAPDEQRWFHMRVTPLRGERLGAVVSHYNITARKLAEEAMKKSEERFHSIIRSTNVPMALNNEQLEITFLNPAFVQTFGYTKQDIPTLSQWWPAAYPDPQYRQWVMDLWPAELEKAKLTGLPFTPVEVSIRCKNGTIKTVMASAASLAGSFTGEHLVVLYDITQLKQAEEILRVSQTRLSLAARAGGVGTWDWHVAKNELIWDDEMYRLYGLAPGQFGGVYEAWKKGLHPEDAMRVEADIQSALRGEKEYESEFRVVWPDGSVHYIRALGLVQRSATGQPLQMIGTNWDITAQKQNEEQLRESEARFRALFDSAAEAIMTMDQDGHILSMNRTAEVILGFSAEETLGTKMEKFFPSSHLEQHPGYLRHNLETDEKRITGIGREVEAIHKDGHRVPLYLNVSEARIDQKRIFMGILRDLTAEKQAEQEKKALEGQLMQSQKMEALGVLAGGIAHDFNNLLQSILGYGDLALQWNSGDERTEKALTHIVDAGNRARDLVKQILDFSRRESQDKKPLKLDLLLGEVRALINRTLPKNIKFHVSVPTGKRTVLGNASQIHQVLVNLCTNAIHAMPKGGHLDLEMDTHTFEPGQEVPSPLLPNITYKRITVRDSGSGIDPAVLPRIFEPFFTTKGLGGTGLGLSVVHGIVAQHSGAITVKSELGVGTEFIVFLPTVETASETQISPAVLKPKHAGVVLLIDDEPLVLDVTQSMLEGMGFQVKAFYDPKRAVEAFTVNPAGYDLVLTDYAMPDMDGEAVCEQLRKIAPELRIGVISAMVNNSLRDRLLRLGVEFVLEKPFTSLELANRLAGI